MISSGGEVLHPNARILGSEGGHSGILYDGRSYSIPAELRGDPVVDFDDFMVDISSYFRDPTVKDVFDPQGPAEVDRYAYYVPKPGGEYTRNSFIESSGSQDYILQERGGTFIFVQGKESACIVSRDFLKDKKLGYRLQSLFTGFADPRMKSPTTRRALKEYGDIDPFALVTVNLGNFNEEKGFDPDSSCKDPGSRPVNEEAAINLLKQKLQNETINETIQAAISAFQCLCGENFKAHEIEVYAFQNNKECFLEREEIERHLTVINQSPCLASAL